MTVIEQIKAEIERRIALFSSLSENTVNPNRIDEDRQLLSFISTLESEKPMNQDGLEENIKHYIEDCGWEKDSTIPVSFVRQIASHFYDLGCRRTAEKYDEIEYNRQRAEEQGSEGLEEEIKRYLHSLGVGYGGWVDGMDDDDLRGIARHFAQWGAEHLADARKTSPKDLEEAAEEYEKKHTYQRYDGGGLTPEYDATLAEAVLFGAKWDREQMMKGEIDAKVEVYEQYEGKATGIITANFADIPTKDICGKVRIIIVKED